MKVLVMTFLTDQGKKASLRIKDVKDTLDELSVVSVMDTIIEKNIFVTTAGALAIKDSAEILETTTEVLNI
ncbi:DUF2922 family protein [Clostridium bovifaecis]|uniref:DUF2922 family protein n=1 Tax=Clostridium bovifaecis TaxID=2184719 RepID=A0A6I6EP73_9CLOT|nr:DUF2922 family protein [Clostridium bovifaecis]